MFKRLFSRFTPRTVTHKVRSFAAAALTRFVTDWITSASSIDADLKGSIAKLRVRARDLEKNSEIATRYFQVLEQNIVGPNGFLFQAKVKTNKGEFDEEKNREIEERWNDWKRRVSVCGKLSLQEYLEQVVRGLARDGEHFTRIIIDPSLNAFGVSLQAIDPALIDDQYNDVLRNGNIIRMGIELEAETRRPVAYYFSKQLPDHEMWGGAYADNTNRVRIPANEIIHIFKAVRPDQTRGWSYLAPVMLTLRMLGGYLEAALVNARASAAKMGFWELNTPDAIPMGEETEQVIESSATQPGMIEVAPFGAKFREYNPSYPSDQFVPFVKRVLMLIASGLNISYVSLTQDLEAVNYSSIRYGALEEREFFKKEQTRIIDKLLIPVFGVWLKQCLTTGILDFGIRNYSALNKPYFLGPRWSWVDPQKEITAKITAIKMGLMTMTEAIGETGGDFYETMDMIKKERDYMNKLGLSFTDAKTAADPSLTGGGSE